MFEVPADEVYDDVVTDFEWEKYQRGFNGVLNNAYNQSCNSGTKVLGNMSEITSDFTGGSYDDFIEFYEERYDGAKRRSRATQRMTENLVKRVESVGGSIGREKAVMWAERYIDSMLVNSYRGFAAEDAIIEGVAERMGVSSEVANSDKEVDGIDGYIDGESVQVKPASHTSVLDVNDYDTEILLVYTYDEDEKYFYVRLL